MTAKREAELETENRMLREQVASLEKIIERVLYPVSQLDSSQLVPYAAPQPLQQQWWTSPGVVWCGTETTQGTPISGLS
jgi:hypothetical protein